MYINREHLISDYYYYSEVITRRSIRNKNTKRHRYQVVNIVIFNGRGHRYHLEHIKILVYRFVVDTVPLSVEQKNIIGI